MTEEEKEKMEITNNLSELDQMSAQELVEAAKKGIKADFNGVVTKVSVVEGATEHREWNCLLYRILIK